MKHKNLFLKIYIPFVIVTIIALIVLQILGSKKRIGYLTDFNLNIERTLSLNNLKDIGKDFTVDGKLNEESIKNYLLTNESIANYVYQFRIRYYNKVFRNSDIYGVYPDLSGLPDYMENAEMEEGGSPYGNFITSRKTIETENIDVNYTLKIKLKIPTLLYFILALILFLFIFSNNIYNFIKTFILYMKKVLVLIENKFIILTIIIGLILFVFQFWLGFPGYFQEWDWYRIQEKAFNLNRLNNWDPILYVQLLRLFFHLFGVHSFYFFAINLLCCWVAIILIIISLYLKFRNRFLMLLYFIPFITGIFFYSFLQIKDYIFSLHLFLLYSLIFARLLINPKNNLVKILIIVITGILLIITLLLRHNAIATIYPIFILFTYTMLKKSFTNLKLYLLKFIAIMLFAAIILVSIVKFTPRIFLTKEQAAITGSSAAFAFNIGGIAYTSGDYSLIPTKWFIAGKNSKDLWELYNYAYYNDRWLFTEGETFFKVISIDFRNNTTRDIKEVFEKYIFNHPISYIKFISMVGKCLWFYDFELKKDFLSINGIQVINTPPGNNNFKVSQNYPISEQRIIFNDLRLKIYTLLYNASLNINNIIPISICMIIFFLSGLLWLLKNSFRNKLLLFTFCVAFSGFATALIVIIFSPSGRSMESRYISPVCPIAIISLISFIAFIYDRGGFKKFIKELRGNKK